MSGSYWLADDDPEPPRVRVRGRADVAVVGAGVTGCACAHRLAQAGLRVRVHEAREIASGASGRNGGFALRGGAMPYDHARRQLGPEVAAPLWRLTERYVDRLAALAGDAFRRTGSLRLAADETELTALASEHARLRDDGFDVEWHDDLPRRLRGLFRGGILHPPDGALHPARWVRRLARLAAEAGAEILEHAPVASLAELDAEQVVVATDGYTRGLLPALDRAVTPTRGQVVATEPLARRLFDRPHYARWGYDYWQQTPDGRLVVGGCRDASFATEETAEEETTPLIQRELERLVQRLVGDLPAITHRWSGIFGVTADRLPLAGRAPGRDGVWVAAGYSGHGNVLGLACGELVAEAILGRAAPELALFDPARLLELE